MKYVLDIFLELVHFKFPERENKRLQQNKAI